MRIKISSLLLLLCWFAKSGFSQSGTLPINAILITDAFYQTNDTLIPKEIWYKYVALNAQDKQISAVSNDVNALNKIITIELFKGAYNALQPIGVASLPSPQNSNNEVGLFTDSNTVVAGDTVFIKLIRDPVSPCVGCNNNTDVNYTLTVQLPGGCIPANVTLDSHLTLFGGNSCSLPANPLPAEICTLKVCSGEQLCLRMGYVSSNAYPMCGPGNVSIPGAALGTSVTVSSYSVSNGWMANHCFTASLTQGIYLITVSWTYFPSGYNCSFNEPPPFPIAHTCYSKFYLQIGPAAPANPGYSVSPTPICAGGNACLTANNAGTPGFQYYFESGNTQTGDDEVNTTGTVCFPYANVGTYNTALTVNNGFCQSPRVVTPINVQGPSATFNIVSNGCRNYTLQAIPACVPIGAVYNWNIGGTLQTGNPVTLELPGNSSSVPVSLTITSSTGTTLYTTSTNINTVPTYSAAITTTSDTCGNIRFTATPSLCIPANAIYTWTYGFGGLTHVGNPVVISANTGATQMAVDLTITTITGTVLYSSGMQIYNVGSVTGTCCGNNTICIRECTLPPIIWTGAVTLSGTQTFTDRIITVLPNTTINIASGATITFSSCSFLMYEGSGFLLNRSISGLTFDRCYLRGCKKLWEGIKFDPNGGTPAIAPPVNFTNSMMEDAVVGFDFAGNTYVNLKVNHAIFNKNITAIKFINKASSGETGFYSALSVKDAVFTCRHFVFGLMSFGNGQASYNAGLANQPMVSPKTKNNFQFHQKSLIGISVEGKLASGNSYYGNGSQIRVSDSLIYDNLVQGITIKGLSLSRFTANTFKNITSPIAGGDYPTYYTTQAAAINYAGTTTITATNPYVNNMVGPVLLASLPNTFNNCYYAVYAKDKPFDVLRNNLNDCYNGTYISNTNVAAANNTAVNTLIGNNVFSNLKYTAFYFYQNASINTRVANNQISFSAPANYNLTSRGVQIHEYQQPAAAKYLIENNDFANVFEGVLVNNTNATTVSTNTITLNSDVPSYNFNTGVLINNSYAAIVDRNQIYGNGNQNAFQEGAIRGNVSPMSRYSCNKIFDAFTGFGFQGITTSNILKNDVTNSKFGVWNAYGAIIGIQDNPNYPGQPSDNRWINSASVPIIWHSYMAVGSIGANNTFYTRTTYPHTMLLNGFDIPPATVMNPQPVPNPTFSYSACRTASPPGLMSLAPEIAQDVLYPQENVAGRTMAKKALLTNLLRENINTQNDALLDDFKNTELQTNIGTFYQIDKNIEVAQEQNNPTLIQTAKNANNNIAASDSMDMLQQQVNAAYFRRLENGNEIDSSDLALLDGIAKLCPYQYGTSVFQARSLVNPYFLNYTYLSECEKLVPDMQNSNRIAQVQEADLSIDSQEKAIQVYPNPNEGTFNVLVNANVEKVTVLLYSTLGTLVMEAPYNVNGEEAISIKHDLKEGAYILKVMSNGLTIGTERIIVTK